MQGFIVGFLPTALGASLECGKAKLNALPERGGEWQWCGNARLLRGAGKRGKFMEKLNVLGVPQELVELFEGLLAFVGNVARNHLGHMMCAENADNGVGEGVAVADNSHEPGNAAEAAPVLTNMLFVVYGLGTIK